MSVFRLIFLKTANPYITRWLGRTSLPGNPNYFAKLTQLLDEYPKCFIVGADNVGSKQMQQIRISLRGEVRMLFVFGFFAGIKIK